MVDCLCQDVESARCAMAAIVIGAARDRLLGAKSSVWNVVRPFHTISHGLGFVLQMRL